MPENVKIHISRQITVERPDQAAVTLLKGENLVSPEIAEHPFVKHFLTSAPVVEGEVEALRARVAELEEEAAQLRAEKAPATDKAAAEAAAAPAPVAEAKPAKSK